MKLKYLILIVLSLFCVISCDNGDDEKLPGRTVLIFLGADNNLDSYAYSCLRNIVIGAGDNNLKDGNLLVYIDPRNGYNTTNDNILNLPEYENNLPKLIQIKKGKGGVIEQTIVKEYSEHNSASPEVMRSIFNEVFLSENYKAESYGLVLWSHGTAWLPSDIWSYLRSFGDDNGTQMEISTLKEALKGYHFDFLIFDACYMGSIEVAYALRDNADYILGSPTEILADSMPYDEIVSYFFSTGSVEEAMKKTGQAFYNYYNKQSGYNQTATVGLVKTKELAKLAEVTNGILKGKEEEILKISVNDVQLLEYLTYTDHALYDFSDYVKQIASVSQYNEFKQYLDNAVVYKESTEKTFFERPYKHYPVDPDRFCGLSSYLPQSQLDKLNTWYKDLDWYKAVYQ